MAEETREFPEQGGSGILTWVIDLPKQLVVGEGRGGEGRSLSVRRGHGQTSRQEWNSRDCEEWLLPYP